MFESAHFITSCCFISFKQFVWYSYNDG